MQILSHRGYWKVPDEKNALAAFSRSFHLGFGTETDIRDLAGELVISHDPPLPGALTVRAMFELYRNIGCEAPLALNIKADGLQELLIALIRTAELSNYFVFDMSIPDSFGWLRVGARIFTRQSENEPTPAFYDQAAGIWLDSFKSTWWTPDVIADHLSVGKSVCVVSPDLHGRDPRPVWDLLRTAIFVDDPKIMLCTDKPEEAMEAILG